MLESIQTYFAAMPSSHRMLLITGGITFFWLIEYAVPRFRFGYNKWQHALINFFFTFTTIVVNFLLAFAMVAASNWATENEFGLSHLLASLPWVLSLFICLAVADLIGSWLAHFVSHKVKFLWRFHLIHHTDVFVDTTSANRHHPGESLLRVGFTSLAVLLVGMPIWMIFLYQSISVVQAQFEHANIFLPEKVDRILSWLIVTPNMHHVHHHYVQPYTDSNYGNIFGFWDRLFGTYMMIDRNELKYGIDTHLREEEHSRVGNLLQIPFQKYRPPVGAKFSDEN